MAASSGSSLNAEAAVYIPGKPVFLRPSGDESAAGTVAPLKNCRDSANDSSTKGIKKRKKKFTANPEWTNRLFGKNETWSNVGSPCNKARNNSSIPEWTFRCHYVARNVILKMESNERDSTEFLAAKIDDGYSNEYHQKRAEKLLKRQIELYLEADKPSHQIDTVPNDVAAEVAATIRREIQGALEDEVITRISLDRLVHEKNIEESKNRTRPLEIKVVKTDSKMTELYQLLLRRTTSNFIDLHYFQVMEAQTVLKLYLQHISPLHRACSAEVTIVTGRGLHSKNGVPKLLPAVKNFLEQQKIWYEEDLGSLRIKPMDQPVNQNLRTSVNRW